MDDAWPTPQGAHYGAYAIYLTSLNWELRRSMGFMVSRVRPTPNRFLIIILHTQCTSMCRTVIIGLTDCK